MNPKRLDNRDDAPVSSSSRNPRLSSGIMDFARRHLPSVLTRQLERPTVRAILANTSWLSGQQILALAMSVFVGAWIARYLGPERFGILSYALAATGLLASLSTLGLDEIVVRELVKSPDDENEILGSVFVLLLFGSIISLGLLILMSFYFFHDQPVMRWTMVILGAGFLLQVARPIDFWFRSQMLAKYLAIAGAVALVVVSAARVALILTQAPILLFAATYTCQSLLYVLGIVISFRRKGKLVMRWRPKFERAFRLIGESWPLIIGGIAAAIYMKIDQVMLGLLLEHETVGIYAAAVRVSEVWYLIPTTLASSALPAVVRSKKLGSKIYKRRMQSYYDVSFLLAMGLALPITFLAPLIVRLLFGSAYTETGTILAIHIWASPFVFIGVARGAHLVSEGLIKFAASASVAGALVNVVLNLLLVPRYGGIGAAIATVISQAAFAYFSSFFHPHLRETAHMQTKAFGSPGRYILGFVRRRRV